MSLISEALLKQLLKSGMPVIIIPQSSLEDDEEEGEDTPIASSIRTQLRPYPS